MSYFHSFILSLIQGITEFLPISSSGHLILIPRFFGWDDQGLAFDAIVHLATSAAVLVYYRETVVHLLKGLIRKEKQSIFIVSLLLLSTIPAVFFGLLLKDFIAGAGRSVLVVMLSLLVWGTVLILVEYYVRRRKKTIQINQMKWYHALLIGLAQSIALIPGTSRSGITLSTALLLDLEREEAVKFSFLMSVPVILGAGGLSFLDLLNSGTAIAYGPLFLALAGAFFSGLAAIHLLRIVVAKKGLLYFGLYRIILAAFLFFVVL